MCLSAKLPTTKHNHTWARNYRTPAPRGAGSVPGERGRRLPLQMPFRAAGLAPKLHSSPLVWSQGCDRLQSSFSCLAQTLQQPQPSGTSPTPGAHCGGAAGHWHTAGQGEPRACGAERPVSAGSRAEPPDPPPLPPSLLSRTAGRPAALTRRARQRRAAARAGRVPADPMSSAGAEGSPCEQKAGARPARSEATAGATALYRARGRRVRRGADVARSGPRPRPALAASQECGWRAPRPPRPAPSPARGRRRSRGGSRPGRAARGARRPLRLTRGPRPALLTHSAAGRGPSHPGLCRCRPAGSGGGAPRAAVRARDCSAL